MALSHFADQNLGMWQQCFELRGCFKAVATIVAGAASNPDALRVRGDCDCKPRYSKTSALHQGVWWQRLRASLLNLARGLCGIQRPGA